MALVRATFPFFLSVRRSLGLTLRIWKITVVPESSGRYYQLGVVLVTQKHGLPIGFPPGA